MFLPTSTHGGVQLWYGTLQVGPYLESRAQQSPIDLRFVALRRTPSLARIAHRDSRANV